MAKKVIKLTEEELDNAIKQSVNEALQEIKGRTLARMSNSAINSTGNIQRGVNRTFYGAKAGIKNVDKDDNLIPKATQSFLSQYKSTKFLFWTYRRVGNPINVIFKVDNIKKLIDNVAILSGEVIFGREQLSGDIVIDFKLQNDGTYKRFVSYKYKGNKYKYTLEPNTNTKPIWDDLVNELEECLTARDKCEL